MPSIKLNLLQADPRNANVCSAETLEKIRRNIERSGHYPALIVRPHPTQEGHYLILDGHHRKRILQELGYQEACCEIWDVGEPEALLALATLNRLRGEDEPRKRAQLIDELSRLIALPEMLPLIPETEGRVRDLKALLELDWEEQGAKIERQIAKELSTLPVPFACMIDPADFPYVEKALSLVAGENRGQKMVAMSKHILKEVKPHDKT